MPKAQILKTAKSCGDAILIFSHHDNCTDEQKELIKQGLSALINAIHEISIACASNRSAKCKSYIKEILQDVHTRTDYSHDEKLIRDLADVCVTLRNILENKHRTHDKLMQAKYFFDFAWHPK